MVLDFVNLMEYVREHYPLVAKRLTSLHFHEMLGFRTATDKRKSGRMDFDLVKVDDGAVE